MSVPSYYGTPLPSSRISRSPFQHPAVNSAAVSSLITSSAAATTSKSVFFADNTSFNVKSTAPINKTPMPKKPIMTRRDGSIDVGHPAPVLPTGKVTPAPLYLQSSSSHLDKENSDNSLQAVSSTVFSATPIRKRTHSGLSTQTQTQTQTTTFLSTPTRNSTKSTKRAKKHGSSSAVKLGPFSVKKKAKLTPPRPRTTKGARKATVSKKSTKKRICRKAPALDSQLPTDGKDIFSLRTSEHDPSPYQVELPSHNETLTQAKMCHIMDTYMKLGGIDFNFNDLIEDIDAGGNVIDDATSKECYDVISAIRNIVHDIKVEGFYREYVDGERVEACIFSSHMLRQFIVCFRGGTSLQNKPVRGTYFKPDDDNEDCILHAKHPVAVMPSFRSAYFAGDLEENIFYVLNRLSAINPFCDVVMTGHSFGAAIATLSATRYAALCPQIRVSCTVFGSPRVGGDDFCQFVHSLPNLRMIRIERNADVYTCMPEGRHAGHSLSLTLEDTEEVKTKVTAYRFDKGKPGPDNFLLQSINELYRITGMLNPLGLGKEAANDLTLYIEELEKVGGSKWSYEFAGLVGDGVKSGLDNERRLVV